MVLIEQELNRFWEVWLIVFRQAVSSADVSALMFYFMVNLYFNKMY